MPQIKERLEATPPQPARNAPCPCGSGRRYKHCCGRQGPKAVVLPDDPRQRLTQEIPLLGATAQEMDTLFAESDRNRPLYRDALADLQSYLLFIGYPRSGHSLIGALLDAHPDMVVAHELDVLRYQAAGFDREQIAYLLIRNSELFASAGRGWGGYDYQVPGQWQGRFRKLRVLGDKKGGSTTLKLGLKPERLDHLEALFEQRARYLHVVRNPFDCIATIARRTGQDLDSVTGRFFEMCAINRSLKDRIPAERLFEIRHEDMLAQPAEQLRRICAFLQVAPEADYLAACAAIVTPARRPSREKLAWRAEQIAAVEDHIERYDFLAGYRFTEAS